MLINYDVSQQKNEDSSHEVAVIVYFLSYLYHQQPGTPDLLALKAQLVEELYQELVYDEVVAEILAEIDFQYLIAVLDQDFRYFSFLGGDTDEILDIFHVLLLFLQVILQSLEQQLEGLETWRG